MIAKLIKEHFKKKDIASAENIKDLIEDYRLLKRNIYGLKEYRKTLNKSEEVKEYSFLISKLENASKEIYEQIKGLK